MKEAARISMRGLDRAWGLMGRPGSSGLEYSRIALLAVLMAIAVGRAWPIEQPSPQEELKAATAAERSGQYDDAARHYEKYLAAEDTSPTSAAVIEVRTRLATALFMLHRYRDSLQALQPLPFEVPPQHPSSNGSAPFRSPVITIPAQAWLVRGLDCLELNQLPEAIRTLHQALILNPDSGTARLALADALARSGRLEEAADDYRAQLRLTPNLPDAWYKLGVVYSQLARKVSADLARQPTDSAFALELTAEEFAGRGDAWGAARILLPVIYPAKMPSSRDALKSMAAQRPAVAGSSASALEPLLRAELGAALFQLGYPNAAEEAFKAALSLDPESLPALLGTAEVEALRSNWVGAVDTLRHLMAFYPENLARRLELPPPAPLSEAMEQGRVILPPRLADSEAGMLWIRWLGSDGLVSPLHSASGRNNCSPPASGKQREVGYWTREACYAVLRAELQSRRDGGPSSNDQLKLIEADFRLGNYQEARDQARSLLKTSPNEPWASYWLARSYLELAGQSFDKLANLNSDSPRVHELLARHYSEHQQFGAARKEYEAALRLAPELPDLHLGLGTVYWQGGDWSRAEEELKKVLQLSPGSAVASYELGDCYIQQHEWRQAEPHLQRALSDPGVGSKARFDLAKAEAEQGDPTAAIRDLLRLTPGDRDGEVHYRLGMLYRKIGEPHKAQEALATSEALRSASDQVGRQQLEALEHARQNLEHGTPAAPK